MPFAGSSGAIVTLVGGTIHTNCGPTKPGHGLPSTYDLSDTLVDVQSFDSFLLRELPSLQPRQATFERALDTSVPWRSRGQVESCERRGERLCLLSLGQQFLFNDLLAGVVVLTITLDTCDFGTTLRPPDDVNTMLNLPCSTILLGVGIVPDSAKRVPAEILEGNPVGGRR